MKEWNENKKIGKGNQPREKAEKRMRPKTIFYAPVSHNQTLWVPGSQTFIEEK